MIFHILYTSSINQYNESSVNSLQLQLQLDVVNGVKCSLHPLPRHLTHRLTHPQNQNSLNHILHKLHPQPTLVNTLRNKLPNLLQTNIVHISPQHSITLLNHLLETLTCKLMLQVNINKIRKVQHIKLPLNQL